MGPTPGPVRVRRLRPQVPAQADNCSILASFQQIANDAKPLREHRLMPVLGRLVVAGTLQVVGQVLLGGDVMGMIVGVEVPVAVPERGGPGVVSRF